MFRKTGADQLNTIVVGNIDGDDVGRSAVYLISDLASGVTGENIYVDAGYNTVGL